MRANRSKRDVLAVSALAVLSACAAPGNLLGLSTGTASASPAPGGSSGGSTSSSPGSADAKAYDCPITKWDRGECGGPTEGTITRDQIPAENPPPKGKTGRTVVGPVGFGKCQNPGKTDNQRFGLPSKPADPWLAVDAKRVPAALPLDAWQDRNASVLVRQDITGCTAAHDHCFRDCTWMIRDVSDDSPRQFVGIPAHRRSDGVFSTSSGMLTSANRIAGEIAAGYTAYRTVPATKRLLAEGRLVAVLEELPASEREGLSAWTMGTVLRIDYEAATVQLKGGPEVFPLAATRVVVLTSKNGGPVELTAGMSDKDIVVKADEVFLPAN